MSDEAVVAADPAAVAEAAAEQTGAAEPAAEPSAQEQFPRSYVEELRAEAAGYRTKAKDYDSAFERYSPEQKAAMLDIARGLADPDLTHATANRLKEIADSILGADPGSRTPTGEEDPDSKPLTKREWKALQEEQAQQSAVDDLLAEVESLGYEPGTPEHGAFMTLLLDPAIAGDPAKAHAKMEERESAKKQAIIDEYVKSVQEKGGKWPAPSSAGSQAAGEPGAGPPKTLREATKAAMAHLQARAGE